jgi:hypothetical protein
MLALITMGIGDQGLTLTNNDNSGELTIQKRMERIQGGISLTLL